MRQSWGLSNPPTKSVWQRRHWQIKLPKVGSSCFRKFLRAWVLAKPWLPHSWVYSSFKFFLSSLRQTFYINVQVRTSLEISFQISLCEKFPTKGCAPAQFQEAINPVWNKIFQQNIFWWFSFINDTNMYENLDILRWSLSPAAWFLQTLALNIQKIQSFDYFVSRIWWIDFFSLNPTVLLFIILQSRFISFTGFESDLKLWTKNVIVSFDTVLIQYFYL